MMRRFRLWSEWRRDALRTNLWLVPMIEIVVAAALFALGDTLCKVALRWRPSGIERDRRGYVRVITAPISYERVVERANEKIRQASRGMPAVMIRQLDALAKVMQAATVDQHRVLLDQAAMIERASVESVAEEADRADVRRRYEALLATARARRRP